MMATWFCFFAGLLPVLILHLGNRYQNPSTVWVVSGERSTPVIVSRNPVGIGEIKASDLQALLDDVRKLSRPGDGLFVGPSDLRFANYNDTFIYYLLPHLRPVSRYLEMNPGCSNRADSGLTEEISTANWLILTTRYDRWEEPNASVIPGSSEPNEFIRTHFCMRSKQGVWQLLQRC